MFLQALTGILFAAIISLFSYRFHLLTKSGAVAQFVLGSVLLGVGGWQWTFPILTFFLLSSLLSKFGKNRRAHAELYFDKSSHRDAWQVLANGGVAGLLVIWWSVSPSGEVYVAYLGAVAAVTADTWGTEIGTLSSTPPRLITNFAEVEHGRSGAISLTGLLAGVAGCGVIFMSALPWLGVPSVPILISVVSAGLVGTVADSYIGATVQLRKACVVCGRIVERDEHCGAATKRQGGFEWIKNDQVNLAASAIGAFTAFLIYRIFT